MTAQALRVVRPAQRRAWILPVAVLALAGCGSDQPRRIRIAAPAAAAGNLAAGHNAGQSVLQVSPAEKHTIAILNFRNQTGDPSLDWLQRGLTDMLASELGQSPLLNVLNPARLEELLSGTGKSAADVLDDPRAAGIARVANVETLLHGRYYHDGRDLVIDAELRETSTGTSLRQESVRGPGLEGVFVMVGDLSRRVRQNLRADLDAARGRQVELQQMTGSVEAFRHYSRGLDLAEQLIWREAEEEFRQAVNDDPDFAAAWLWLSMAHGTGDNQGAAFQALEEADKRRSRLSPADQLRLDLRRAQMDGDMQAVLKVRDGLEELAGQDVEVRRDLAMYLFTMAEYDQAIEQLERVLEQDPRSRTALNHLGYAYAYRGDFSTALKYLERYRDLTPNEPNAHDSIGEVLMMAGRIPEAAEHFKRALDRWPTFYNSASRLFELYSETGDIDQALPYGERFAELLTTPRDQMYARVRIAEQLWRYGRTAEAEKALARARTIDPLSTYPLAIELALRQGSRDQAAVARLRDELLERIAKADPADRTQVEVNASLAAVAMDLDLPADRFLPFLEAAAEKLPNLNRRGMLKLYRAVLSARAPGTDVAQALARIDDAAIENAITSSAFNKRRYVWRYIEECVLRGGFTATGESAFAERLATIAGRLGRNYAILLADSLRVLALDRSGQAAGAAAARHRLGMPPETAWRVIGPYDNRPGFDRRFPPETPAAATLAWKPADDGVADGFLDLNTVFDRRPWSVAYATTDIVCPDQRVVQIRAFSSEPYKLWLNGEPVWKCYGRKDTGPDRDLVTVVLRPGRNQLLVKTLSTTSDWGIFLRLTDETGKGYPDIDFAAPAATAAVDGRAPAPTTHGG